MLDEVLHHTLLGVMLSNLADCIARGMADTTRLEEWIARMESHPPRRAKTVPAHALVLTENSALARDFRFFTQTCMDNLRAPIEHIELLVRRMRDLFVHGRVAPTDLEEYCRQLNCLNFALA